MLFKRNYLKPTIEEVEKLNKAKEYWNKNVSDREVSISVMLNYHDLMPDYGYHIESLFPNNYLSLNYKKHFDILKKSKDFRSLLQNNSTKERHILNFIKDSESYYILESLFHYYDFGHHDAYLFREFPLPPNFVSDFLLVGKNSGGYEFIFIEFESLNEKSTLKNGELANSFRKGIQQAKDWEFWVESNFHMLKNVFKKYQNPNLNLPSEFIELDKSRIHFLVIAGRRGDFKEKSYRLKRQSRKSIKLLHYDNLLDTIDLYISMNRLNVKNDI